MYEQHKEDNRKICESFRKRENKIFSIHHGICGGGKKSIKFT